MDKEPLKIKRRGEDDYRVISVRIREDTLKELEQIAADTNYSRNELINMIQPRRQKYRNRITGRAGHRRAPGLFASWLLTQIVVR